MSRDLEILWGDNLAPEDEESKPLVEGLLWEEDVVMLLGKEKGGKSILAQEMAFALTAGETFLNKFKVPNAVPIVYLQTEGKRSDISSRINRMAKVLPLNRDFYFRFFRKFFPLDIPEYQDKFISAVDALPIKPKVIFIDALYMSMVGDLISNEDIRRMNMIISDIQERYKCAIVIVHHETKEVFDNESGKVVDMGDKKSYGSVFLRAFVDHILYLDKRGKRRILSCATQREGKVIESEELTLVEPDPLFLKITENSTPAQMAIISIMTKNAGQVTIPILFQETGYSKSTLYDALSVLVKSKAIERKENGSYALLRSNFQE